MSKRTPPMLAAIAAVLLAGGCEPLGHRGGKTAGGGSAPGTRSSPARRLEAALRRRVALTSLQAEAYMRIKDLPRGFSLRVNCDILAQRPDHLRIHASKAMGNIEVFDTVMAGREVAFYVPRKRTLYRGRLADLSKAKINFNPSDVLRQLLWRNTGLELRSWIYSPRQEKSAWVLEEHVARGRKRLRLAIDRKTGDLVRIERLDGRGRLLRVVTYGKFRVPETRPRRGPALVMQNGARFPFSVRMEWPLELRSVKIEFRSLVAEALIAEEMWYLDVPERTRIKPIAKIRVEGDKEGDKPGVKKGAPPAVGDTHRRPDP